MNVLLLTGSITVSGGDIGAIVQLVQSALAVTGTSPDGTFAFQAVLDGQYTVLAYYGGGGDMHISDGARCHVAEGSAAEVRLRLP